MKKKEPAKNSHFYIPVKKGKTAAAVNKAGAEGPKVAKKAVAKKSAAPKKK